MAEAQTPYCHKPHPASNREDADAGTRSVPLVSVVIPHYNDLENLCACLILLAAQTIPKDQFEVIVADNNSMCGLAAVQKVCSDRAKVVPAFVQGAAEARNAGVMASRGRYLAFIDSDCRPAVDWLERGLAALATADMVGGRVDVAIRDERNPTSVEAFEAIFAFNNKRYVEEKRFSVTANMFTSRRVFEKVGGFRLGIAEDKDWGRRASGLGFHLTYAPDVRVSHPARRDWKELRHKWRRLIREAYATTKEERSGRIIWVLKAWLALFSSVIHVLTVLRSPKLDRLGIRLNAIGVLFRIRWWRFIQSHKILFTK